MSNQLLHVIFVVSLINLFGFLLCASFLSLIILRLDALLDLERRRVISIRPEPAPLSAKDFEMEMNSVNWKA